jgi:type IV pilus assembly protein PilA
VALALRQLSPLEAASGISIIGSVLAVAAPAFVKNLHASRLVEPVDGLARIAARATAFAASRPAERAYPEPAPLTPAVVPRADPVTDPAGTWDHPTWRLLDFSFSVPHSYSFSFESHNAPGRGVFRAVAQGDLDGDGLRSTFEVTGESRDGAHPVTFPLESTREVE